MPRTKLSAVVFNQFLSTQGNGGGDIDMVGDYSGGSTGIFYLSPPSGYHIYVNRILIYIQDTGAMDADKYGNNVTLNSGVVLDQATSGNSVIRLITPRPVLTNGDWGAYCYDVMNHDFGIGDEILLVRWTFGRALMPHLNLTHDDVAWNDLLKLADGEKLRCVLNDDFSGLTKHRICVQGVQIGN